MTSCTSGGNTKIETRRESRVALLRFAWRIILRIPETLVLASLYTVTSLSFLDCKPGVPRRYRNHFIPECTQKSIYRSYNRNTHRSYHSNWPLMIQLPLVLCLPYSNLLLWQLFIQGFARVPGTRPYQSYPSRHYVLRRSEGYCTFTGSPRGIITLVCLCRLMFIAFFLLVHLLGIVETLREASSA